MQQCPAGLIRLRRATPGGPLAFAAPPLLRSGVPTQQEVTQAAAFLGIEPEQVIEAAWVDNGPGWLGIRLASAEQVLALDPARSWPRHVDIGVVGPHRGGGEPEDPAFEVRAFFSDHTGAVVEDPVTGSLNASLGQWLLGTGVARAPYLAAQGTRLGRAGRIQVSLDPDDAQVWIGGATVTQVTGRLHL